MKNRYNIIILLMAISLFGIIVVQVLWIRHAIKAEEAQFDKSVYSALNEGISQLEKEEMFYFMDTRIDLPPPPSIQMDSLLKVYAPAPFDVEYIVTSDSNLTGSGKRSSRVITVDTAGNKSIIRIVTRSGNNSVVWNEDEDVRVDVEVEEMNNQFDEEIEFLSKKELSELEELKELDKLKKHEYVVVAEKQLDSLEEIIRATHKEREVKERLVEEKMRMFNKSVQQWAFEYSFDEDRFLGEDIGEVIREILERTFTNSGISLPFQLQIVKEEGDSNRLLYPEKEENKVEETKVLTSEYKTELYPDDFYRKDLYLLVDFPSKSRHIYKSVSILAFGSMTFTIIILLTFGMTLYYINKQKKISDIKSDFINNMTHEFKTPIATINLAADTMGSPKIAGNTDQTKYYLNIIRQENKRMNNQVEKVLQMALIDNHDLQLDFQKTDIHPIIENTVKAAELTAKEKKGKIVTLFRATCSEVPVDEIHFANILNNLLDNAMKYTENPPEILVETYSRHQKVFVKISDNGIGMSREVQKHIFDKFYRRPSGNIHNIKGFGLGLSYVKAIVDAHGGTIAVISEPGNGSTFTLSFDC